MQRLTKGVEKYSIGLSKSFNTQKRLLSEAPKQTSSTPQMMENASLAQQPKFQKPRAEREAPKLKRSAKKRPPVAWPQRPGQDPAETTAHLQKTAIEYPYFVPRNSNGCVPVYSDFKSNKTREITLIRNVEGNVNVCTIFDAEYDANDFPYTLHRLSKMT
jgi:Mitochondrial large subunit ribosomal protein (Img2)